VKELVAVSEEVATALAERRAVVALETTLVAHGFPPGEGAAVGLESERRVRAAGAVPATIGVLDGKVRIGLTPDELARFDHDSRKVGPRDLAAAVVQDAVGATTVGGTLAVCRAVGIGFMGTGGLGGVHRGFPNPPDVSADLGELVRTEALIVSSGVKSILDVAATAELLETLGVPVLGYRTDDLPLFYNAHGGGRRARALAARPPLLDPRRPSRGQEPRRRRAADRARAHPRGRARRHRTGRHAVRPLIPPSGVGRAYPHGEPGPDRRQCRPGSRDRRRLCRSLTPSAT
jgi:pseudouridine-5'-phosphate glycosidase